MKHSIIAIAGLLLIGCADGEAPQLTTPDIPALMAAAKVPGLAVATIDDCSLKDVSYYGLADIETGAPVDENTIFEAASLTKTIFSLIVNQLADEGVIDLDEPLAQTFAYPRVADQTGYAVLTPRMILEHRSGFSNWYGDPNEPETWKEITFKNPPDTKFGYSGEAYQLLQAYVEDRTGESFEDLFNERLGDVMPKSGLHALKDGTRAAYGHDKEGGKEKGRALIQSKRPGAAYSGLTNAKDYAEFLVYLCKGGGMSPEARNEMLRPQSPTEDERINWALGWGVQTSSTPNIYFHWGDNGHFKSFVAFNPQTRDGVVFFANAKEGLTLIDPLSSPVVGDVSPIVDWLDYGRLDPPEEQL